MQELAIEPWALVAAGAGLLLGVLVAGLLLVRRARRRRRLRRRYGAEYDHAADRTGSPRRADAHLLARERERGDYRVRELHATERERFRARWEALQAGFVADPWRATRDAEHQLIEVAGAKGYPATGEHPLAGVSVDHPRTFDRYRQAVRILAQQGGADADTEGMRRTLLRARDLFETLVGAATVAGADPRSAFRSLIEDDEDAAADPGRHDEDATSSQMPLSGPDGRPLWDDHAGHRP